MPVLLGKLSLVKQTHDRMSSLETFQLTHPELLSETELREILKCRCIDFSNYERLSRSELIEMYKKVAMPLPQRQQGSSQNLRVDTYMEERNSTNEFCANAISSNSTGNLKRNISEVTRVSQTSNARRPKSPTNEFKHVPKKIHLSNSRNGIERNGIEKRPHDGKYDGSPLKKYQKITWP